MNDNIIIGKFGESLACAYLKKKGYKIIGRNLKLKYQEIDIIARISDKIVFIEVKTRTNKYFGGAEEAIFPHKIDNFKKAVALYIAWKKIDPEQIRLDVVAIDIEKYKKIAKIKHFKDII